MHICVYIYNIQDAMYMYVILLSQLVFLIHVCVWILVRDNVINHGTLHRRDILMSVCYYDGLHNSKIL